MLRKAKSHTNERNPSFLELTRQPDEGNAAWCDRALEQLPQAAGSKWTCIALLGGKDTLSFRIRVAQSTMRSDLLPSYWSESAILVRGKPASLAQAKALYVPLAQPDDGRFAPADNGVVSRPFAWFDDPAQFPNVALIALPVAQAGVVRRVDAFRTSRSTLDALEHLLRWLAFCWGVSRTGNPLLENYGIPSSCMLETVFAAENFDLTPGLESRSSCPEAIWSAALYWHEYFRKTAEAEPVGRYAIGHGYDILDEGAGKKPARPRRTR